MTTTSKTSFTGTSNREDLAEALRDAIKKADEALGANKVDFLFTWKMDKVGGERGGIAGKQEISVTIITSSP